jgi:hypothetical protein
VSRELTPNRCRLNAAIYTSKIYLQMLTKLIHHTLKPLSVAIMRYFSMTSKEKKVKKKILLKSYGDRCWWCKKKFSKERPMTLEHLKPKSKGGDNRIENLRVACLQCNKSRGNHDEWTYHPREKRFY